MWTKERIDKLTPAEIKSLRKNALERGANDVAALCDEASGGKLKGVAARKAKKDKPAPRAPRAVRKLPP